MKRIIVRLIGFLLIVATVFLVTGCDEKEKIYSYNHEIIEVAASDDVIIDSSKINGKATYYNYLIDDVTIQIFAVRANDNTIRVLFNTCGSCNPSPLSYFVQVGNYFECQNCKNRFHMDEIGLTLDFGCSPITILDENKKIEDNNIVISSEFIENYKSKFQSIDIYKV